MPSCNGKTATSAEFETALDELLKEARDGEGLAFLLEKDNSPTRERLRGEIEKKFPQGDLVRLTSRSGLWKILPKPRMELESNRFNLDKADVILALDSDFLGTEGDVDTTRKVPLPGAK